MPSSGPLLLAVGQTICRAGERWFNDGSELRQLCSTAAPAGYPKLSQKAERRREQGAPVEDKGPLSAGCGAPRLPASTRHLRQIELPAASDWFQSKIEQWS